MPFYILFYLMIFPPIATLVHTQFNLCSVIKPVHKVPIHKQIQTAHSCFSVHYLGSQFKYRFDRQQLIATFLFFSAGSYFSLNKLNIVDTMGKINILCYITYPVLVIINLLFPETAIAAYAYNVSILTGIVFTMNLCELLIRKEKIQIHPLLTESSFFIFALHV